MGIKADPINSDALKVGPKVPAPEGPRLHINVVMRELESASDHFRSRSVVLANEVEELRQQKQAADAALREALAENLRLKAELKKHGVTPEGG